MGCALRRGAGRSPHGSRRGDGIASSANVRGARTPTPSPTGHRWSCRAPGCPLGTWGGGVWLPTGQSGLSGALGCPSGGSGGGGAVAHWAAGVGWGGWLPNGHRWLCGDPGCPLGGRRAHGEPVEHLESCRRRRCRRALHRSPAPPMKRGGARRLFPPTARHATRSCPGRPDARRAALDARGRADRDPPPPPPPAASLAQCERRSRRRRGRGYTRRAGLT